jgi:cell division control protein 6
MSLFEGMLKNNESVFLNPEVLDFDYQPKLVPFRETHQKFMASCIKPLFQKRNGKNLFIFGPPGIGKTVSCRHVLREIEEETSEIIPIYINVWKANTAHKIALEICDHLDYRFIQDKSTEDLIKIIVSMLNKKSLVLCLDEVDKLKKDEYGIIYHLLEDVYRKAIIIITNEKEWLATLDNRIMSRLLPEELEFKPYTQQQVFEILEQRAGYAFVSNALQKECIKKIAEKTFEINDVRTGLYLLRESGEIAEAESCRKITSGHADKAIKKLGDYKRLPAESLGNEEGELLELVKNNSGKPTKDVHLLYNNANKEVSYKTFRRKLEKLRQAGLIEVREEFLGVSGKSSTIHYNTTKTLSEF